MVELLGTVDMVLEVVSPGSVRKDTDTLRQAYWEAGNAEYWLVDARGDRLDFRILKHGSLGYTETRKQAGWLRSTVFARAFPPHPKKRSERQSQLHPGSEVNAVAMFYNGRNRLRSLPCRGAGSFHGIAA